MIRRIELFFFFFACTYNALCLQPCYLALYERANQKSTDRKRVPVHTVARDNVVAVRVPLTSSQLQCYK